MDYRRLCEIEHKAQCITTKAALADAQDIFAAVDDRVTRGSASDVDGKTLRSIKRETCCFANRAIKLKGQFTIFKPGILQGTGLSRRPTGEAEKGKQQVKHACLMQRFTP